MEQPIVADIGTSSLEVLGKLKGKASELLSSASTLAKENIAFFNPMQCDLSVLQCNTAVYYVIGMIILFIVLFVFRITKYSKISLMFSTLSLCMVFIATSLLLVNLCVNASPNWHSYLTLGIAILLTITILSWFNTKQPEQPHVIIAQPSIPIPEVKK